LTAFGLELVELVVGDAGHAALVLLPRAIDIEVAKARDLVVAPGKVPVQSRRMRWSNSSLL
jgi:hypothetical protein